MSDTNNLTATERKLQAKEMVNLMTLPEAGSNITVLWTVIGKLLEVNERLIDEIEELGAK